VLCAISAFLVSSAHAGVIFTGGDLRTAGSTFTDNDGAVYLQYSGGATGTGLFDTFLAVHTNQVSHPQRGYNTDLYANYDEGPQTRSLTLGEVPIAIYNGMQYREFVLDINQTGGSPELSVDQVEIYLSASENISTHAMLGVDGSLIYSLNDSVAPVTGDETTYDYLLLDNGNGSGTGDMILLVPEDLFAGGVDGDFIYLYSLTGFGHDGTDGFEEWGVSSGAALVPEPATLALLTLGMFAIRRKR
jgi:hypothetical protein